MEDVVVEFTVAVKARQLYAALAGGRAHLRAIERELGKYVVAGLRARLGEIPAEVLIDEHARRA